ncbi:type VII secretion-associated serine protease mycosin [Gordonia jinhuaensis]|uniref:Protease n=1 Tax=Gordonia jinhuaensis TaxID=1517702 RepID=A0A916WUZ4_9ACTN|nr:putative protease [Gordonia jinhuaensis]
MPSASPIGPTQPTEQASLCATPSTGGDHTSPPDYFTQLRIAQAWKFSRGAGQKIAVIDSGVARVPRLSVIPGGDYVSGGDGTSDCDGHGTMVAGVIAGHPSASDGFAGVAPDASIIAIRQHSDYFRVKGQQDSDNQRGLTADEGGYGNVATMARAVVQAVNKGATVINISQAACEPVGRSIGDGPLGAAVRYAYQRNVVVVAAAGNVQDQGKCNIQNPLVNPADPSDPWGGVRMQASPAWFSDYVLTVGATDGGDPASFTLHGPWVGVAAPGTGFISLSWKRGGDPIATGTTQGNNADGSAKPAAPIAGTSYAAPIVAGLAALIRAKNPGMSAHDVIERIERTAHGFSDGRDQAVGYGAIDPVAALSDSLPYTPNTRNVYAQEEIAPPVVVHTPSDTPRYVALGVAAGAVVAAGVIWLAVAPRRRAKRLREDIDY